MKSEQLNTKSQMPNAKNGVALIIILVLITAITVIGLSFIVRGDTELLCGQNMEVKANMDYLAESGLEHGRGLIMYPHDLPGEPNKYLAQQLYTGSDYYDVDITKLSELNWQIKSAAYRKSGSSNIAQSNLTAELRLDPAIAFWSGSAVSLSPAVCIAGDVYCNGILNNSGIINGDCFADLLTGNSVTGVVSAKTDLTNLGFYNPVINSSRLTENFSKYTILNPFFTDQTLDSSEVYYKSTNFEIRKNVIINGCLAVDGNLTVSDLGNVITAKKNMPAVYVSGDLILKEGSALDCNGLVWVGGKVEMPIINQSMGVKGALFTNGGIRYILPDSSGNGYNGIINGDCAWVSNGVFNSAINFDGNGDFIDIGNPAGFAGITNQITVAAWIKVNSFDYPYQAIITKGDTSWRLQRENSINKIQFACNTASGTAIAYMNGNTITYGQWYHIAGVYDGTIGTITLYLNGWPIPGYGKWGDISSNPFPVYIGENAEIRGRYFNGAIDSVCVYARALSSSEISALKSGSLPSEPLGFWKMNAGDCSTTINASPVKAAIYDWPAGSKERWSPAAGAFYKSITR